MLKLKLSHFAKNWLMELTDAKNWLIGKDSDAAKDWRQEEKGTAENEMIGWVQLGGHEFVLAPGVGDGQGGLACCNLWARKNSRTWQSNWTEVNQGFMHKLKVYVSLV